MGFESPLTPSLLFKINLSRKDFKTFEGQLAKLSVCFQKMFSQISGGKFYTEVFVNFKKTKTKTNKQTNKQTKNLRNSAKNTP